MRTARIVVFAAVSLALGIAGCKSAQPAQVDNPSQDPAAANLAPVSDTTYTAAAPQAAPASQPAPAPRDRAQYPDDRSSDQDGQYASGDNSDNSADYDNYDTPVEYASDPPPQLPDYQQPACPGDDYMWTPGYWDYDNGQGYYWVPGAWVLAPYAGALWTPSWWGYDRGRYGLHRGFWGRHIGYYGGIDYGHGYEGHGYEGGYWSGDHFSYNRTVNNINTTVVHNVYNYNVTNITNTRISYNGGRGGITIRPRPAEIAAVREQHNPPMTAQLQQTQQARSDRQNFARVNNGRPAVPVVSQPLPADREVRPPAPVNYQAQQPRAQQPVEAGKPQAPQQLPNNIHPVPEGPHVMQEHPPAQGAPANPRNATPTPPPNRPPAPENNHQPAPGRPMVEHPAPQPQPPQPARPAPAPPPVREPQQRQPQQERPAPTPPPARPEPQRVEPSHPAPPPPQRAQPTRPAPPPTQRAEPSHPAPPPPQHPAQEKKPKEPKPD
jgi:hypothetical protein